MSMVKTRRQSSPQPSAPATKRRKITHTQSDRTKECNPDATKLSNESHSTDPAIGVVAKSNDAPKLKLEDLPVEILCMILKHVPDPKITDSLIRIDALAKLRKLPLFYKLTLYPEVWTVIDFINWTEDTLNTSAQQLEDAMVAFAKYVGAQSKTLKLGIDRVTAGGFLSLCDVMIQATDLHIQCSSVRDLHAFSAEVLEHVKECDQHKNMYPKKCKSLSVTIDRNRMRFPWLLDDSGNVDQIGWLFERSSCLESLSLIQFTKIKIPENTSFPCLTRLDFQMSGISDDVFASLLPLCPNVRELCLRDTCGLSGRALHAIGARSTWRVLDLYGCTALDANMQDVLDMISSDWNDLKRLAFAPTARAGANDDSILANILRHTSNLSDLEIGQYRMKKSNQKFSLPHLRSLQLWQMQVCGSSVINLLRAAPNLANLKIESCPSVTTSAFRGIGQYCKKLKKLSLRTMTCLRNGKHELTKSLSSVMPTLDRLTIASAKFNTVEEWTAFLKSLSNLKEFVITFDGKLPNFPVPESLTLPNLERIEILSQKLTEEVLISWLKACPNATHLSFFYDDHPPDDMSGDKFPPLSQAIKKHGQHLRSVEACVMRGMGCAQHTFKGLQELLPNASIEIS